MRTQSNQAVAIQRFKREEVLTMCKTCGCQPCKCGRKIVNGVCAGCSKPYNNCTCAKKK